MGRKSLKKDRAYLTTTEWANEWGGYKDKSNAPFRQLPFHCCAIAFTPFEDPACTSDGTVYDLSNIFTYIRKFHKHPVTGEPLSFKDIIPLKYHKNVEGQYHCPVLNKVFTAHTHIVAIKPSGNVYCMEAIQELNIKQKYWKDLLTDEPFVRKEIITLQDPMNLAARNVDQFDHVKHDMVIDDAEVDKATQDPLGNIKKEGISEDMQRMLAKLHTPAATQAFDRGGGGASAETSRAAAKSLSKSKGEKINNDSNSEASASGKDPRLQPPAPQDKNPAFKPGASTWNTDDPSQAPPWVRAKMLKEMEAGSWRGKAKDLENEKISYKPKVTAQYVEDTMRTTGDASRSLTSSAVGLQTKNKRKLVRVERNPKKKGYLRLHTSLGDINIELHCDLAPRTCENFIALAESGYYDKTVFHRSIKNFMIQGGDPSGTGTGGESIYGPTFADEMDSRLLHSGRGVLSMANSGPHTNGSQFFILFKSAHHLDYKHSVFGRVVGGLEVLTAMEKVETDEDDRPQKEINIAGATVFVNPYKEMEDAEKKVAEEAKLKAEREAGLANEHAGTWFSNPGQEQKGQNIESSKVGRYLTTAAPVIPATQKIEAGKSADQKMSAPAAKKQKQAIQANFDAW